MERSEGQGPGGGGASRAELKEGAGRASGPGPLPTRRWVLGSPGQGLEQEQCAGVGGKSSLSHRPRPWRLPPSPVPRLTPELRHQQRQ